MDFDDGKLEKDLIPVNTGGRPTKCTDDLIEQVALLVEKGNSFNDAGRMLDITGSALSRYMREGEKHSNECKLEECTGETCGTKAAFHKFFRIIKKAEAIHKDKLLTKIEASADKGPQYWTAAAWILERRYPAEFGKRDADSSASHSAPKITINVSAQTREKMLTALNKQIEMEKSEEGAYIKIETPVGEEEK